MRRSYPAMPIAAIGVVIYRLAPCGSHEFLLIRRARPPRDDCWSLPGGVIELGETAFAAATREIAEELGLDITPERLLDVVDIIQRDADGAIAYHYLIIEIAAAYQGGAIRADAAEIAAYDWFTLEAAAAAPLADKVLGLLRQIG